MKLQHRTILITGGTSGIGLEMARQLIARGNVVVVTGRDPERLAAARRSLSALHTFRSDVRDPEAMAGLAAQVLSQFPQLDTLINNAGIMRKLDLAAIPQPQDVTREIDINFSGPIRMVQLFLPHLLTRGSALVVNVSSGLAYVPLPVSPVYSATKAAIHSYTRSLRVQLRGTSVRVVEVAPPGVETPLFRGEFAQETRGQKAMDPRVLVEKVIAGIEAGEWEVSPGLANVLRIMGRLAPDFMLNRLAGSMSS